MMVRRRVNAPLRGGLRDFRESVKRAKAVAVHRNILIIQEAAKDDWRAALWWLKRVRREDWGRKRAVAVVGNNSQVALPPSILSQSGAIITLKTSHSTRTPAPFASEQRPPRMVLASRLRCSGRGACSSRVSRQEPPV